MAKKSKIKMTVSRSVNFSTPLLVWNIAPPPPQALPKPAPLPWMRIRMTTKALKIILAKSKKFLIPLRCQRLMILTASLGILDFNVNLDRIPNVAFKFYFESGVVSFCQNQVFQQRRNLINNIAYIIPVSFIAKISTIPRLTWVVNSSRIFSRIISVFLLIMEIETS